jgi:hypothetical protein
MGDVRETSLEKIWNAPRYVELRQKLLQHGIFPVCRRCCKVELRSSSPAEREAEPAAVGA